MDPNIESASLAQAMAVDPTATSAPSDDMAELAEAARLAALAEKLCIIFGWSNLEESSLDIVRGAWLEWAEAHGPALGNVDHPEITVEERLRLRAIAEAKRAQFAEAGEQQHVVSSTDNKVALCGVSLEHDDWIPAGLASDCSECRRLEGKA